MVQKIGLLILGIIAVVALGGLVLHSKENATGQYYAAGGGRYYYGEVKAQMSPEEACVYSGLAPVYPSEVYTNEYGTMLALCKDSNGNSVGVPLVQTVVVP